ncbi:perforin-1-like [Brachyistius frenatus]|uniref:perforin-1-like n=1 Tax=Brachyistius frenatus TaxID=100188 RepID=UPI0037E789DE
MTSSVLLLFLLLLSSSPLDAQLKLFGLRASGLSSGLLGTPDGYVKVFCGSASLGETSVINNNPNPWWEEEFTHFKAQENDVLRLEVHDSDFGLDDLLGVCQRRIKPGTHQHDCYLEEGGTLRYSYSLGGDGQQARG